MKKSLIVAALVVTSFQAFAQDRCEMRVQKLQDKVSELRTQLASCESNGGGANGEINYLRSENYRLTEENRQLQIRLDAAEGRGEQQFFCAATCVDAYGSKDKRYMSSAVAYIELEANTLAKQATQKKYSCNYGVKIYNCESFTSQRQTSFCIAACVDGYGTADERYSGTGRGRNRTEAEVLALQEAQSKHSCNYGTKIVSCN